MPDLSMDRIVLDTLGSLHALAIACPAGASTARRAPAWTHQRRRGDQRHSTSTCRSLSPSEVVTVALSGSGLFLAPTAAARARSIASCRRAGERPGVRLDERVVDHVDPA